MDVRTGEIKELKSVFEADELKNCVEVNTEDMTEKQEATKQVSKYDNRSKLGKVFTGARKLKYSEMTKNQKRNFRKKHGLR